MDQIDRLERLAKLRADGALTEEEYQAQKAIVLQSTAAPPSPAPSPSMGPAASAPIAASSPSAGGVIEGPPPKNRNAQILAVSLALLALVLVAALVAWRLGALSKPPAVGSLAVASAQPVAASAPASEPTKEQAFAIVYPGLVTLKPEDRAEVQVQFKPLLLYRMNENTFVLLSVGKTIGDGPDENMCHPCSGFYSIAYFSRSPTLTLQGAPFVREGSMGGWGQPPELALLKTLGPQPMVLVRSGFMNMGAQEEGADLVLLGPTVADVSIVAENIGLSIDNTPDGHCSIEGTIKPKTPGKSFIIRYTGSFTGDVVYQLSGKTYRPPAGTPELWDRCPDESAPAEE